MLINGIPDSDLALIHWRGRGGKGELGIRHTPSGITVTRECPPDMPVLKVREALLDDLEVQLRREGILGASSDL
jgi:hypothetical protein